jgi:hypothetical protein
VRQSTPELVCLRLTPGEGDVTLRDLSFTSTMPLSTQAPFASSYPALYLYPLNESFVPKHISLAHNQRVKIGRQTNAKTAPGERNGFFDSKVLSRQHAEVWEEENKVSLGPKVPEYFFNAFLFVRQILIKDVKSSNGTFINGERLSPEGLESEPFVLKSDDIVVCNAYTPYPRLEAQ